MLIGLLGRDGGRSTQRSPAARPRARHYPWARLALALVIQKPAPLPTLALSWARSACDFLGAKPRSSLSPEAPEPVISGLRLGPSIHQGLDWQGGTPRLGSKRADIESVWPLREDAVAGMHDVDRETVNTCSSAIDTPSLASGVRARLGNCSPLPRTRAPGRSRRTLPRVGNARETGARSGWSDTGDTPGRLVGSLGTPA